MRGVGVRGREGEGWGKGVRGRGVKGALLVVLRALRSGSV